MDLNKNCIEYAQGKVDSDNVEIRAMSPRYHFCEYSVLVGAYTRSYRVLCGGI